MTNASPPVQAFNAGEVSPLVEGRYDLEFIYQSSRIQENIHGISQGPAVRRPGTKHVVAHKNSAERVNLVDFEFDASQSYVLEIGNGYMRVCKDRAQVVVLDTNAVIANGDFASDISSWTDESIGGTADRAFNAGGWMDVTGHSSGAGWAEQSVATASTGVEHTLRFDVLGVASDTIELRIGTATTGAQIIDDLKLGVGHHAIAFTPPSSPFSSSLLTRPRNPSASITWRSWTMNRLRSHRRLMKPAPWRSPGSNRSIGSMSIIRAIIRARSAGADMRPGRSRNSIFRMARI